VKEREPDLLGSDTMNKIIFDTITHLGIPSTVLNYVPLGAAAGERQMRGNPNAGEPTCTGTEPNPGCQEISPMTRGFTSAICGANNPETEAEIDAGTGQPIPGTGAHFLNIGLDALVVVTDNVGHCVPGVNASTNSDNTATSGADTYVRTSAFTPADLGTDWKSALKLIYTGCQGTECASTVSTLPSRQTRCTRAERKAFFNLNGNTDGWARLVPGCSTGTCPGGLRQVYRRDDAANTMTFFLDVLGIKSVLGSRSAVTSSLGAINAEQDTITFCDGGQTEGFFPSPPVGSGDPGFAGDPLRKPCAAEDDLCDRDGSVGVVRAVRTAPQAQELVLSSQFPLVQCTKNSFALLPYINSSAKVCPDNTAPISGNCWIPFYNDPNTGKRDFNCLNPSNSRPPGATASFDGRIYNFLVHPGELGNAVGQCAASGETDPNCGKHIEVSPRLPWVANWRQNSVVLNTSFSGNAGGTVPAACTQPRGDNQIACLISKTTCTIGFGGRETASNSASNFDNGQEPFLIEGKDPDIADVVFTPPYAFQRDLSIAAIGGFLKLHDQCLAAGRTIGFCDAEVNLVRELADETRAHDYIVAAGFAPKSPLTCTGSFATAGCGPVTPASGSFPLADCIPPAP
jgi:hypothetical protein